MGHPQLVRAARLVEHGSPLRIEEVDLRPPGPGEVEVEITFAGVNPVDRYIAEGTVAPDGPLPRTLGGEASGTLDGVEVLVAGGGLGVERDGSWATRAVVPESAVVRLPEGVDTRQAAAVGVAGATAYNLVEMCAAGAEDRVLVLGASGGVGLCVVSLARSLGASVWGQTGSDEKVAAIIEQGADHVVVVDSSGLEEAAKEFEPTVVVDSLGSGFTRAALASLAPHGRVAIFGASAGPEAEINVHNLYRNGQRILGYAGLRLSPEARRSAIEKALGAIADGRMRLRIDRIVPLEDVNEALALISRRELAGKVVLEIA